MVGGDFQGLAFFWLITFCDHRQAVLFVYFVVKFFIDLIINFNWFFSSYWFESWPMSKTAKFLLCSIGCWGILATLCQNQIFQQFWYLAWFEVVTTRFYHSFQIFQSFVQVLFRNSFMLLMWSRDCDRWQNTINHLPIIKHTQRENSRHRKLTAQFFS